MNILAYVHLRNIHGSTGAGRVARNITEQLIALGTDDVRILADLADYKKVIPLAGAPWDRYRYHFFSRDTSSQQRLWALLDTPKAEAYWPDVDVVYCTAESYVPKRRARSVVTLHDAALFEDGAHARNMSFFKQRLKWRVLFRALDRNVDLFHTVSEFSAERIAHFFPSLKSRLRVVPNGVTARFFQPASPEGDAALQEWGLEGRRFILLPRGLNYRKNADLVLDAWPMLRRLHEDLVLVVTSHCEPAYVEKAKALGDSVVVTGFVSDDVLCSLYSAAAAVWFPSRYEGFGLPILEAMACGAPVVASRAASLPEVAGGAALLAPSTDASAHVAMLDHLLANESARRTLTEKGRRHAAVYTWEAAATRLRAELRSLA